MQELGRLVDHDDHGGDHLCHVHDGRDADRDDPRRGPSPAGAAGAAPTLIVPTSAPPTQLECADLIVGTGPKAKDGDAVTVQYVLGLYSSGKVFQSSWTSGPFQFTIGGNIIPG